DIGQRVYGRAGGKGAVLVRTFCSDDPPNRCIRELSVIRPRVAGGDPHQRGRRAGIVNAVTGRTSHEIPRPVDGRRGGRHTRQASRCPESTTRCYGGSHVHKIWSKRPVLGRGSNKKRSSGG